MTTAIVKTEWIWFDCDGTLVDLYGTKNWLQDIINESPRPYEVAKPLYNMENFKIVLQALKSKGYKLGIISWLAKNPSQEYSKKIRQAKRQWLKNQGVFELFDSVRITKYGIKKSTTCKKYGTGVLVDDEKQNLESWTLGGIIDANKNILEELTKLFLKKA